MKDYERKKELFNQFFEDNKKLISYTTAIFQNYNSDPSVTYDDFQQEAKISILDSIDACNDAFDIVQLKKLYKTHLFRKLSRIKRNRRNCIFGHCVHYDDVIHDKGCVEDHVTTSINQILIREMFQDFLKYIEKKNGKKTKFGKSRLYIDIFKELTNPSKGFIKLLIKERKEAIKRGEPDNRDYGLNCVNYGNVSVHTLRKHFKVSQRVIHMAVKELKEMASAWMSKIEKKNSILVKD